MRANSIDDVIEMLGDIINTTEHQETPIGYFAALYRKVTIKVKDGIANGDFIDAERMEKLDIRFANRYLEAYHLYSAGNQSSLCWMRAFEQADNKSLIVLQHLLLGMNAHINYDLGIATAEVGEETNWDDLHADFNKINKILASLVFRVEYDLSKMWPGLKKILKWTGIIDNFLIGFSMRLARDGAWKFAINLRYKEKASWAEIMLKRDKQVGDFASMIDRPNLLIRIVFIFIRRKEVGTIGERIAILKS